MKSCETCLEARKTSVALERLEYDLKFIIAARAEQAKAAEARAAKARAGNPGEV